MNFWPSCKQTNLPGTRDRLLQTQSECTTGRSTSAVRSAALIALVLNGLMLDLVTSEFLNTSENSEVPRTSSVWDGKPAVLPKSRLA